MTTFEWKADYSVGHDEIDRQHQRLLAILNDLYAQLQGGRLPAKGETRTIFDRLAHYVNEHFVFEEQLMVDAGYPDDRLMSHIEEHDFMRAKVRQFEQLFDEGDADSLTEMMLFLYGDWLIHHICGTDSDYRPWIETAGGNA